MDRQLQNLNWKEVRELIKTNRGVILPVGTMEAHGCANLGTDITIPKYIAGQIASELDALIAPTINYGITRTLLPYPGSSTISPEVFEAYVYEVAESLINTGFEWIMILNGHGGNNEPLENIVQKLWEQRGGKSIVIHWWDFCEPITNEILGEKGTHAGLNENYMVMAANPELVKEDLYDQRDIYEVKNGAYPYPKPGTILTYQNEKYELRFDSDEAKKYASAVTIYIAEYAREVLEKWNRAF